MLGVAKMVVKAEQDALRGVAFQSQSKPLGGRGEGELAVQQAAGA